MFEKANDVFAVLGPPIVISFVARISATRLAVYAMA